MVLFWSPEAADFCELGWPFLHFSTDLATTEAASGPQWTVRAVESAVQGPSCGSGSRGHTPAGNPSIPPGDRSRVFLTGAPGRLGTSLGAWSPLEGQVLGKAAATGDQTRPRPTACSSPPPSPRAASAQF